MACGHLLWAFWICALLFDTCDGLTIPKGYRQKSQDRNIGDDADDERLISPGSELEDSSPKPASLNTPNRGSFQQGRHHHSGQGVERRVNPVAQAPMGKAKPLVFPLKDPAHPQLGAGHQQLPASGLTNSMSSPSSGFSVYAAQSGGHSPHVGADSTVPEHKPLRFEEVFTFASRDSGPVRGYGAGKGYNEGGNSQGLGSFGSTFNAQMPFFRRYSAQSAGPMGMDYRNVASARYNAGLHSHGHENVPHRASAHVMPPLPPLYNPVYLTQSRYGYNHASYTHTHSKYSPDTYDPVPLFVNPPPPQDVPSIGTETQRAKW